MAAAGAGGGQPLCPHPPPFRLLLLLIILLLPSACSSSASSRPSLTLRPGCRLTAQHLAAYRAGAVQLQPGDDTVVVEAVLTLQLLHLFLQLEVLPADGTVRVLVQEDLAHTHCRNILNIFLRHRGRARSIHLVQELCNDSIKATSAPSIITGVSVNLHSGTRYEEALVVGYEVQLKPWPRPCAQVAAHAEDDVLNELFHNGGDVTRPTPAPKWSKGSISVDIISSEPAPSSSSSSPCCCSSTTCSCSQSSSSSSHREIAASSKGETRQQRGQRTCNCSLEVHIVLTVLIIGQGGRLICVRYQLLYEA